MAMVARLQNARRSMSSVEAPALLLRFRVDMVFPSSITIRVMMRRPL